MQLECWSSSRCLPFAAVASEELGPDQCFITESPQVSKVILKSARVSRVELGSHTVVIFFIYLFFLMRITNDKRRMDERIGVDSCVVAVAGGCVELV